MAKDPAFLFYPGDWLGGTMGFTFEQKGAYLELLIFQFNNGKFTIDQAKQVLSICFTSAWQVLCKKFKTDGEFYWNERLDVEKTRRQKFSESRRNNASSPKKQEEKKKSSPKKTPKAYAKHMETEDENEIEIKKEKEPREEIFLPFESETFARAWSGWKEYKKTAHNFNYKGLHSEQIALKRLSELSNNNENIALQIIEQSIGNGWEGLFEIKNKTNGHTKESIIRESNRQAAEIIERGNPYARKES